MKDWNKFSEAYLGSDRETTPQPSHDGSRTVWVVSDDGNTFTNSITNIEKGDFENYKTEDLNKLDGLRRQLIQNRTSLKTLENRLNQEKNVPLGQLRDLRKERKIEQDIAQLEVSISQIESQISELESSVSQPLGDAQLFFWYLTTEDVFQARDVRRTECQHWRDLEGYGGTEPLIKFSHEEIQLCKKLLNKILYFCSTLFCFVPFQIKFKWSFIIW